MRRRYIISNGMISFDVNNYLTIEALEDELSVSFPLDIEYGIDGIGWKNLSANTSSPSISKGQTISFRGNLTPLTLSGIGTFSISKKCDLKGNCMSMLFGDNAVDNYSLSGKDYAFYMLFYKCTNVVNVSSNFLPATTLASNCYKNMFMYCTNLTTAPELPATTLANDCYDNMFMYCTNLTTAPELPATTLADYCYSGMFSNCYNLTTVPTVLPATTLADYCYMNMFYLCSRLTSAPELPASTLTRWCYYCMFGGCHSLKYIKMLATNISVTYCLYNWVEGVASTGTFVKNPTMNSLPTATSSNYYAGIPRGWTVVNEEQEGASGGSGH
jgi:hypothetical protein